METTRYVIALLVVAFVPGVFLYWFLVHPFVDFWRRLGARWTMTIQFALMFALAGLVYLWREPILAIDFGTRWWLHAVGFVLLLVAGLLRWQIDRRLSSRTLMGFPELEPERYESELVTEGLYARVRHPRYAQLCLALLAWAMIANHLATWVVFALSIPWAWAVTTVEERELVERFGERYERYREQVPRFVPRPGSERRLQR